MFGIGSVETLTLAFIGPLGPMEMLIIGVVAVLLFGSRLPSVARSLGQGMMEFKKGMHGIQDEVNTAVARKPSSRSYHDVDDHEEATAPKFEPPAGEPQVDEGAAQEESASAESRVDDQQDETAKT